ncbi:uncharacterized protein LOC141682760 [Apium graveolens]|uniref:uncharacterized protein LOC141682760 n=1 Tax=Apium graveolens TaxID=4045 RepID=UPI003D793F1F
MERTEAYGYNTGVSTSFDGDLNTINHIAPPYNNYFLGSTTTSTPNPFFQPNYTTTITNNPFFSSNYNTTIVSQNTTNIHISPNYNTTLPFHNTNNIHASPNYDTTFPPRNTTNIPANPFFSPNYNTTIALLKILTYFLIQIIIPLSLLAVTTLLIYLITHFLIQIIITILYLVTSYNNTLSPNYNFQQFITNTTNTVDTFQGAPLTNYSYNNIGLAQNYENNTNMLVNSVQPQPEPQLNIGVQTHHFVGLNQNQINKDEQLQISLGVNSNEHQGPFVFSDGENSGSINGNLAKKRRNATRHKRSSFLPFHQFDYNQHVPAPQAARVIDESKLKFLFQKQLQNSDVNNLKRMVIPKKPAEAFLPELDERSGISIKMVEIDGSHVWTFTYRFWPNNKSRMYIFENTGDFVSAHQLRSGDYIRVFQDNESNDYVIEARKIRKNVMYKPKPKKVRNRGNGAQTEASTEKPMNEVPAAATSLEAGNGLPETQLMETTVDNYLQPNYGFDACSSSSIMDNFVNFPALIDNQNSLIYNDMNFPNDSLFDIWERGTSSSQSLFQNMSFDDIVKGM